MADNVAWQTIFDMHGIGQHDFDERPFEITADQIKEATRRFTQTAQREVRILCKQDCRTDRPDVFVERDLFLLPVRNGVFNIIKGEGYFDIPAVSNDAKKYVSKLKFELDTSKVGDSEMQHLDYAYAASIIRTFLADDTLVLTIRGRKYTPKFSFNVGNHEIEVSGVQTEVDAGYEGKTQVVLVEAKNVTTNNVIIRQLFYPYRQWSHYTNKTVIPMFFEKREDDYAIWQFRFEDDNDYNSIKLVKSALYRITE